CGPAVAPPRTVQSDISGRAYVRFILGVQRTVSVFMPPPKSLSATSELAEMIFGHSKRVADRMRDRLPDDLRQCGGRSMVSSERQPEFLARFRTKTVVHHRSESTANSSRVPPAYQNGRPSPAVWWTWTWIANSRYTHRR